jgi:hypothetical protein
MRAFRRQVKLGTQASSLCVPRASSRNIGSPFGEAHGRLEALEARRTHRLEPGLRRGHRSADCMISA